MNSVVPIVELREYSLPPATAIKYTDLTKSTAEIRKLLTPLRYFGFPETGGYLNVATHLYYYSGGYNERNTRRKTMAENEAWNAYVTEAREYMGDQKSSIFVEAPFIRSMAEKIEYKGKVVGLESISDETFATSDSRNCIIELRRYELKLGYDTVPRFLDIFQNGLPSKLLAAGTDPTTSLVTVLYSEVGQLNEVIEVWRHGGGTHSMEMSRMAARVALEWREAIAQIAGLANKFTTTIQKPLPFSPLR